MIEQLVILLICFVFFVILMRKYSVKKVCGASDIPSNVPSYLMGGADRPDNISIDFNSIATQLSSM